MKKLARSEIKKILVRGPDWVGDFITATPVYRELKKAFPDAKITALVRNWTKGMLKNCPYADEIIEFDSRDKSLKNNLSMVKKIKQENYDLAILLSGNFNAALIAWLAGIKYRAGYNYDKRGFLLTHCLKETGREYRLDRAVKIIEVLGVEVKDRSTELWINNEDIKIASSLLGGFKSKFSKIIGVGPGTQEKEKCLPVDKLSALIDLLVSKNNYGVVLFGSKNDIWRGEKILATVKSKDKVLNLIDKTDLNGFAACLKQMDVYISGDTGGMHVAYTMGVPVAVFFGPTDPGEALPVKENIRHIWKNPGCSPCTLRKSHECTTLECINSIKPEEIEKLVCELI
ncbi:MAG: lipopolysaccharide heptosyltransferase II [Elusimicrobia bacterium RIFOXYA2_FULL_39_19]|nr:MAG: lipopolysaccharide heptosyltransferase II [Elusimicrobia bacterium RIFOXYA2_FULL_39_19]